MESIEIAIYAGLFSFVLWMFISITIDKYNLNSEKWEREIAKALYDKNWRKALRECQEAHLKGDCEICGRQ